MEDLEGLCRKLGELNKKSVGLEIKVGKLRSKVAEANEIDIAKFKELDAYMLVLNITVPNFLLRKG